MTDRDIVGKPVDVTPRLITPEEASELTTDELPTEPAGWAEAWHREANEIKKRQPLAARTLTRIGQARIAQTTTYRVSRGV